MSKPLAVYICGDNTGLPWDEPLLVGTVNPDDNTPCEVAGDCDEPSEWLVEIVGWMGEGEPPYMHPTRYACMAHVGFVMGALLPKPQPVMPAKNEATR